MNQFTKTCVTIIAAGSLSAMIASAGLDWSNTTDLSTDGFSGGEFIQMYLDPDNDSVLSGLSIFTDGSVGSGSGGADDSLIATFSTTTLDGKGGVTFATQIPAGWENTYGSEYVYTVAFDGGSIGSSTQARIFDSSPFQLGVADPSAYNPGAPANPWQNLQAIPEPSTLAFLGLGGLLFGLRRRMMRG